MVDDGGRVVAGTLKTASTHSTALGNVAHVLF